MIPENIEKSWCWLTLSDGMRVMVDNEDLPRLEQFKWVCRKTSNRNEQVVSMVWNGKISKIHTQYLPRVIMDVGKGYIVNRKDPEILDFRKSNLIVCTRKEKERMRGKTKIETTSKYKGVSWRKDRNMWSANICVNDHRMYLGLYILETDAARAYNAAAKKHFGNFAYQNELPDH
jgi:hypothetical protein